MPKKKISRKMSEVEVLRRRVKMLENQVKALRESDNEIRITRVPNRPIGCHPSGCSCRRCQREREQQKNPKGFLARAIKEHQSKPSPSIEFPINQPAVCKMVAKRKSHWPGYPGINFGGV